MVSGAFISEVSLLSVGLPAAPDSCHRLPLDRPLQQKGKMQFLEGRLIVSPSDLTGFLECEHLTQQELAAAPGEAGRPGRKDPELEVLTRRGLEHEARQLASMRTGHRRVVEFPFPEGTIAGLAQAHAQTIAAMSEGVEVIYQGTFFD